MTTTPITTTQTCDEVQIRQLITDQANAIRAKDVDKIMAHYAPNVVAFDVKPPFQIIGADAWRRMWEACLPCMPASSGTEMQDLNINVSGDLAIAHWTFHFTGIESEHPAAQMEFRITASYYRSQGRWQIIHEHCSIPFMPPERI
ncbi:nuclear transport factor 2 family protein [Romeria aff. gracilis LEGE 07310]|uniref:Nuclear transport factor 2 family protein n=1 Tax=Vasconcelosia minhoensis LEGE 07310 TaxID=915328 RepID=A0A8J7AZ77_9CYAN|nr:nuclear transport factor 2 family protein [Romeria gracilis]MBE9079092.1 nuclear transport factor 2 family protein [Romeria aff. gracilis LEGE 07310]